MWQGKIFDECGFKSIAKYWQVKYWQMAVGLPNLPIFLLTA